MDLRTNKAGESLLQPESASRIGTRFLDLVAVMARLRSECPWDRKQTPQSLKRYVLEEAYEVVAAIESADPDALCEELGDHLLQVMFLSQIMTEQGHFKIGDVLDGLIEKLVTRHPHVFADVDADEAQVMANWEKIKKQEKGHGKGLFAGFSHGLPALLESYKISRKAATVGFDWPEPLQVLDKIEEEIQEVRSATNKEELAEELGDLLFAVSNLVRKFNLEPEECLRHANVKFMRRFQKMEELADEDNVDFAAQDLDTQEAYWVRAKKALKGAGTNHA